MAEPKWTPGPWELCRLQNGTLAVKKSGETWGSGGIAIVLSDFRKADACLIAAAPDLYEACEAALERLRFLNSTVLRGMRATIKAVEILEAALRKARGEEVKADG